MATALTSVGIQFSDNSTSTSNVIPSGVIAIWSGSVGSIPSGWYLCDGNNGTPNLSDQFVAGAGNNYSVDDSGGSADAILFTHTHEVLLSTNVNHIHSIVHTHDAYLTANGIHTHTLNSAVTVDPGGAHDHVTNILLDLNAGHVHPPLTTGPGGAHTHPYTLSGHSHQHGIGKHPANPTGTGGLGDQMYFVKNSPAFPVTGTTFRARAAWSAFRSFPTKPSPSADGEVRTPANSPIAPGTSGIQLAPNNTYGATEAGHSHPITGSVTQPTTSPLWLNHPHTALSDPSQLHTHAVPVGNQTISLSPSPYDSHTHAPSPTLITSEVPGTHTHTSSFTIDTQSTDTSYAPAGAHTHTYSITDVVESTSSLTGANMPPFYTLAYIMKA